MLLASWVTVCWMHPAYASVAECGSDSSVYLHETSASAGRDDEIRLKPQVQVRVLEYTLTQSYQLQCTDLHAYIM
jgi:hypothetical protein